MIRYLFVLTTFVITLMLPFCRKECNPPVADKIPHYDTIFNDIRVDNYYWLRERSSQRVIDYLNDENRYTDWVMKDTRRLQKKLFKELKKYLKEDKQSVPSKNGDYYYYIKYEKGKQYPIYCRKRGSIDAEEQVYLDVNKLAKGKKYCRVASVTLSPDQRYIAFLIDTTGREMYYLRLKDIGSNRFLRESIPNVYYGVAWGSDGKTLFYTTLDSTLRPYRVYRHIVGDDFKNDNLIYQENDGKFYVSVRRSRSGEYIFIELNSQVTSEVYFLKANSTTNNLKLIKKREYGIEYYISHNGDYFYITTNKNAMNFKVVKAPVNDPSEKNWTDFIKHDSLKMIYNVYPFRNFLVIDYREDGLRKLKVMNLVSGSEYNIPSNEEVYTMSFGENYEYNTPMLRYIYNSLITPRAVYDFNTETGEAILRKVDEIPGYDSRNYKTERIWVKARDGVRIPVSLLYKKSYKKDGNHSCYLYGYGSYGSVIDPRFSSNRLPLLDRGFLYAIAHIRGGGALGRSWYLKGKLLKKKNTFYDFIDVAEYLINNNYTSKDKLVISGGSAGGLLMGAVVNFRPDLFKVVIAKVPFVDVLNTMLDQTIPLTVIEYDEWGSPNEEPYYWYIKSYSPYDNVTNQEYPNILVTAGLYDPRVQYWEPAKWVAKLRAMKKDNNLLLLKTNMNAGHFGHSGRYDYLKDIAFEYAFIFKILNIK